MIKNTLIYIVFFCLFFIFPGCAGDTIVDTRAVNPMGLSGTINSEAEMYYSRARILWRENLITNPAEGEVCRDPQEAITLLTKCIALEPEYTAAYFRRALAYIQTNEFEPAFSDMVFVLEREPTALSYSWHAFILLQKGQLENARTHIEKSIGMHYASPSAWNIAGLISLAEKNNEKACEEFKNACSYGNCSKLNLLQATGMCE